MSIRTVLFLTVTLTWGAFSESDICFNKIGCLSMSFPWSALLRPVRPPLPPEELPIKLSFYARESRDAPSHVMPFWDENLHGASFNPFRPTIIITHDHKDYGDEKDIEWMQSLKNAYLQFIDANVIILDWRSGSNRFDAVQAAGNIRVVAKVTARFLREMSANHGLVAKEVHLIGDGMGAHLMGYIANDFKGTGRITGLDPSRKFFDFEDPRVRLDSSDAEFVDVIHTSASFIPITGRGVLVPSGHVDFYPNGGRQQPRCTLLSPSIQSLGDLPDLTEKILETELNCNHRRAREYFIEAVKSTGNCVFWGRKVTPDEIASNLFNRFTDAYLAPLTIRLCTDFDCTPLGLDTPQFPARGLFFLTTRRESPYCLEKPSISFVKLVAPFKHLLNSFRAKVPLLQPYLPKIEDIMPVP